ncbi:MAG: hypothetical protein Q4B68_01980 [Bacteroidales bacterium]|nr:hypothetical protein [Bacteroidales bacterium]
MAKLKYINDNILFKIRESQAQLPPVLRRSQQANYREGYFSITINTRQRRPLLGAIREGAFHPSKVGAAVEKCWLKIPEFYPQATLIAHQVMPEHFHGLLHLCPTKTDARLIGSEAAHLGRIIGGFMIGCTHAYWDVLGIEWRQCKNASSLEPFHPNADHHASAQGPALFERGYNDVEPITEEDIATKIQYIHANVERRQLKRDHRDAFTITRHARSRSWTEEHIKRAFLPDRNYGRNHDTIEEAWQQIKPLLLYHPQGFPVLDWMGSRALLEAQTKVPLICHRADAERFEQQKQATLNAARAGAVVVTACISAKEKEIVKALQQEGLPIIAVMPDSGFDALYRPSGHAFYACAEGLRLEITPWIHKAQQSRDEERRPISRTLCLVANQLVLTIATAPDGWWK